MNIRDDFESAKVYLEKLLVFKNIFRKNNIKEWVYLKNKEDFKFIYDLDNEAISRFEDIYSIGRDLASDMSFNLDSFNTYPTLTSYMQSLENTQLSQISYLKNVSELAKEQEAILGDTCPWAVKQMIILFDNQIELLQHVANTLNNMKTTDTYKIENGESMTKQEDIKIYLSSGDNSFNNSSIVVNSPEGKAIVQNINNIQDVVSQLLNV